MKDMDTSILNTLSLIAPDLMEEMELRTLILERVAALEPIGRRALAARLHLAEREVRAAAEALKRAGCLTQSASGMELTPQGQSLVEAARTVSSGRRTLSGIELSLSQMLGVERVCVVHGDADIDSGVMEEVARAAARQIRFLLQDAHVMAVTADEPSPKRRRRSRSPRRWRSRLFRHRAAWRRHQHAGEHGGRALCAEAGRLLSFSALAGRAFGSGGGRAGALAARCASRWNWCVMRMCCFTESDGRWIWLSGAA